MRPAYWDRARRLTPASHPVPQPSPGLSPHRPGSRMLAELHRGPAFRPAPTSVRVTRRPLPRLTPAAGYRPVKALREVAAVRRLARPANTIREAMTPAQPPQSVRESCPFFTLPRAGNQFEGTGRTRGRAYAPRALPLPGRINREPRRISNHCIRAGSVQTGME